MSHKDCEWRWSLNYSKDRNYLSLNKTSHWGALVEMLVFLPPLVWTHRWLWGYKLSERLLFWAWEQETEIWTLDLTPEQLEELNPGDWMNTL